MKTSYTPLFLVLFIFWTACKTTQPNLANSEPREPEMEIRQMDTLVVSEPAVEKNTNENYPKAVYRASQKRTIDLIHTKLDLSFDYQKERVLGEAWIDFTPIFDPVKSFSLDAQYFDIHQVQDAQGRELSFSYSDSMKLVIEWPEVINRMDTVQVYIDYTAVPIGNPPVEARPLVLVEDCFSLIPEERFQINPHRYGLKEKQNIIQIGSRL